MRRSPAAVRLGAAAACLLWRAAAGFAADGVVVSGWVDGLAVVPTEGGLRQRPGARAALRADARRAHWLRGRVELRAQAGGPFDGGHPGVFNFVHTWQNTTPALEVAEAWAEATWDRLELRAGVQRFAWGRLDGVPPTDVLNPRDYHDPLVRDLDETKIGIPAVRGTWSAPELRALDLSQLRVSVVWVPLAVPSRLPLLEERWFPQSLLPDSPVRVPARRAERAFDRRLARFCRKPGAGCERQDVVVRDDLVLPLRLHTGNHRPRARVDDGGLGLHLAGAWRDVEWDLYGYTGPETSPNADLRADLVAAGILVTVDPSTQEPLVQQAFRIDGTLRQAQATIRMIGGDAAFVLGGMTVRAEAAYFDDRRLLRPGVEVVEDALRVLTVPSSLVRKAARSNEAVRCRPPCRSPIALAELFPALDTVEWGIGADYLVRGFFPLIQVSQLLVTERAPRLVVDDPETRFTGLVRKSVLGERVELELRVVYTLERQSWLAFPRASWRPADDLRLTLGSLALGGPGTSLIGQFGRNDEVVLQARWSF